MSADDIFTGGIAELVKRRAERLEADRQRMEEQARGPIRCRHDSHRLIVSSIMDCQNLPCRAFGEPCGCERRFPPSARPDQASASYPLL